MLTVHSKFVDEEAKRRKKIAKMWAPAIPYFPERKKKGKSSKDEEDEDSTSMRTFSVPLDPDAGDDDDKKKQYYTVKLPVFEMGDTPEEWCEWRFNIDDLVETLGYNKTIQIVHVQCSLLKGKSAELYQSFYIKRFTQEVTSEDQQKKALSQVMNDMALKIFNDGASCVTIYPWATMTPRFLGTVFLRSSMDI
ncbi:hypothetical protein SEMRO_1656_G289050.1 [Seminavis robusta]|uniref:Uncharacterized protein n=1 Tax=Seminavis robusta TaxID=568900 RepID=A0A9N8HUH5_9STRA|nr:hypothetical protein SEMRO_1656_G289050.1 [Seminavis robusta]|eukprot:Sro1656_g289050.1 n/a (193) ;mRNA; r:19878-20456